MLLGIVLVGGMCLAGALGALVGGGAVYLAAQEQLNQAPATPAPVVSVEQPVTAPSGEVNTTVNIETAVTEAVDKVDPAVVTVINDLRGGGQASGSGVIISPEGYAVTNDHVVDGALIAGFSLAYLFLIVSPTPSGIGIVEGAMTLALRSLRVPLGPAAVITLAYRGLTFWLPFLCGFVALRWLGRGPRQLRSNGEEAGRN